MVHAAVVAWLMAAAAAGTLLVYAQRHTSETLAAAAKEPPKMATFKAGLETDLDAMRRFRQALLNMMERRQRGWRELLPFSGHVEALRAQYRADYVLLFNSEIRAPLFDGALSQNLRDAANRGDSDVIAAYAEFFWCAASTYWMPNSTDQPMDKLPLPGAALWLLSAGSLALLRLSARPKWPRWGLLPLYLEWQSDVAALQNQRAALLVQLDSMGLENRPLS